MVKTVSCFGNNHIRSSHLLTIIAWSEWQRMDKDNGSVKHPGKCPNEEEGGGEGNSCDEHSIKDLCLKYLSPKQLKHRVRWCK